MADMDFGVRLSADGSGLVGQVNTATAAVDKLDKATKGAAGGADKLAASTGAAETELRAEAKAANDAAAANDNLAGKARKAAGGLDETARSAARMRGASANLGQQIGDITQGLALGISPMTIFAQQGGQVAFAMSGMGGAIGRVATFLSGPWGAAITGGAIILGALISSHNKAAEAAGKQAGAEDALTKSIGDLDRATGLANRSAAESIRLAELATQKELDKAKATRDAAKAALEKARAQLQAAQVDERIGGARGANFGSFGVTQAADDRTARLAKELGALDAKIAAAEAAAARSVTFGRANLAAKAATDAMERIKQETDAKVTAIKALNLSEAETTARLVTVYRQQEAAQKAVRDAEKAGAAATREKAKAMTDAAKEAARYAEALQRVRVNINAPSSADLLSQAQGLNSVRPGERAPDDPLTGIMATLDARMPSVGDMLGKRAASSFGAEALAVADAIGGGIGGAFGKVVRSASGVGALLEQISPGAGAGFNDAFKDSIKDAVRPLTKVLSDAFKVDGGFAKVLGKAAGGAAVGSAVSGLSNALGLKMNDTGAQIGGAIGSFAKFLGPFGSILGSVAGGLIGNLFAKSGSTTVSSSGGQISQSGTGDKAIQRATSGLGNTIESAITAIADQLGGGLGNFSVSIGKFGDKFRVDSQGRGRIRGNGVKNYGEDEAGALSAAIADALKDGAVTGLSAAVQQALRSSTDIDKGLRAALKVQEVETLLGDFTNNATKAFRDFERQAAERLRIARQYGFDLVKLEKVNADQRKALFKETLQSQIGALQNLLDSLRVGELADGSAVDRRNRLAEDITKLQADAKAGVSGANDKLAQALEAFVNASRDAYGTGGQFAADRANAKAIAEAVITQTTNDLQAAQDKAAALLNENNNQNAEMLSLQRQQVALLSGMAGIGAGQIIYGGAGGGLGGRGDVRLT